MRRIIKTISIREDIWEIANKLSKKQNRSISNFIEELILKESEK